MDLVQPLGEWRVLRCGNTPICAACQVRPALRHDAPAGVRQTRDRCPRWYVRRASSSSLLLQTNVRMHSTTIRRTERKRRARKRAFSTIPPTPDGCSSNARTDPASPSSDVRPHSRDARTRSLRFSDARIFPLSQAPSYGNRNRPSEQRQQRAGRRQVHGTVVARRSQTRDGRRDTARSCIFISSFRESSVSLSALGLAWTLPRALAGILKFRYQRSRILDLERVALHDYRIGNIRFSKISIIISTLMSRTGAPDVMPGRTTDMFRTQLGITRPRRTLTHRCSCFSRGGASSGFAGLASIRRVSLGLPGFAGFRVKGGWKLRFLAAG